MHTVLLDTNVIITHLGGRQYIEFESFTVHISVVTVFELLQYPTISSQEELSIYKLLSECVVVPITYEIAERAARLARTFTKHEMDMLIAATALELRIPLMTKNKKDFRMIPELQILSSVE